MAHKKQKLNALVKCSGCQRKEKFWNTIDNWCKIDGLFYCRKCQKQNGTGWYEKR